MLQVAERVRQVWSEGNWAKLRVSLDGSCEVEAVRPSSSSSSPFISIGYEDVVDPVKKRLNFVLPFPSRSVSLEELTVVIEGLRRASTELLSVVYARLAGRELSEDSVKRAIKLLRWAWGLLSYMYGGQINSAGVKFSVCIDIGGRTIEINCP